jgi:hypothetical protein
MRRAEYIELMLVEFILIIDEIKVIFEQAVQRKAFAILNSVYR